MPISQGQCVFGIGLGVMAFRRGGKRNQLSGIVRQTRPEIRQRRVDVVDLAIGDDRQERGRQLIGQTDELALGQFALDKRGG